MRGFKYFIKKIRKPSDINVKIYILVDERKIFNLKQIIKPTTKWRKNQKSVLHTKKR